MKAIVMTAYKRPEYLQHVITSISKANYSFFDKIIFHVEPGNEEVKKIIEGIGFIKTDIIFNKEVLGLPVNPHNAMTRAFNQGCDFALYVQDDCLLSVDAFDICEYYLTLNHKNIFSLCLFNAAGKANLDESKIVTHSHFCSLGYGVTDKQWNAHIKDHYFTDKRGYDWSLLEHCKSLNYKVILPELSRAKHIGRYGGVHYRAHIHDKEYLHHPMYVGQALKEYKLKGEK